MSLAEQLAERIKQHGVDLVQVAKPILISRIQEAAPRDTGALAQGVDADEPALTDTRVSLTVTSAEPYSKFVDEGTGIFGPSGARIFPTRAKVLVFTARSGETVFARSVAGQPGQHWFAQPMPERWHAALSDSLGSA